MTITNTDKNSVIVAARFLAQCHQKDLPTKSTFFWGSEKVYFQFFDLQMDFSTYLKTVN